MPVGKTAKVSIWIAGVMILLILAGVVAVRLLLPHERIRSLAEQRITEITGRQCTIDDLGLTLWRGPALDLRGVKLAAAEGEDVPYTASLEHLYLKMKLLPLLSRRVEIVSLILYRPEIYAVRDKKGTLNLSELVPEGEDLEKDPGSADFSLLLLSVLIEDGVLHYHDYMDSLQFTVGGIDGELNMLPGSPGAVMPLEGSLGAAELLELSPGAIDRFRTALPVDAQFEGTATGDWQQIELTKVTYTGGGMLLDGTLTLDFSRPDSTRLHTRLTGEATDTEQVSQLLLPTGFPRRIDKLTLELEQDEQQLKIIRMDINSSSDNLSLNGLISMAAPYQATIDLDAGLSLEGLQDYLGDNQEWDATGKLNAALKLGAELQDPLATWSASGTVSSVGEATISQHEGRPELSISDLRANLRGRDIESATVSVQAGDSDLSAEFAATNWPGLLPDGNMLASGRASWKMDARSGYLDLPELLGSDYIANQEKSAEFDQDSSALPLALDDGSGSMQAEYMVVRDGVFLENTTSSFTASDSVLVVKNLSADYAGGRLTGEGELVPTSAGVSDWQMDVEAGQISASRLLSPFSSLGGYFDGTLDSEINLSSRAGRTANQQQDLTGVVEFSLTGGGIQGWPALNAISNLTGISELRDLVIDDWMGRLEIRDNRVFGDDLSIGTNVGMIDAGGSVGLDGSLDYGLNLTLNQRLSDRYRNKLPGEIGRLFTGGSGRIELAFDLRGTTENPDVKFNSSAIKRRAQDRIKTGVNKLLDRLLPGNDATPDSEQSDSGDANNNKTLPGLLKRFLNKN